jgi:eukaryotic-like serine/threonine-protein kinase
VIGQTVSHYRILEKLGEGGMGVVYKAQDLKLDRPVALKSLPPEFTRDPVAKQRFIHEARAASALDHQNICNVHDIGETDDGQIFIVMAYYEGETLREKIERGPLKIEEAIHIAIQVAQGLTKAHEHGIIHRDIKPANIMITADGVAKIVDFGLAKLSGGTMLTKKGSTLGTFAYMSPEQTKGEVVNFRTDIWSLGVVLYEMITGQLPFKAEYENAVVYSILNALPEPMTALRTAVPMELERVVQKCLSKDPRERYQHAEELLVDLKALKKGLATGQTTRTAHIPLRTRKKQLSFYGVAAFIAVAAIAGVIYLALPMRTPLDSIAVLPLENRSSDPNQDYFCDNMTDAVITELQKIKTLRVISWTSVKKFKKTDKTLPEIAQALDVKGIVEGSVVREGDTVRITVQLIQASPEKHLWGNIFDRAVRNVLALQSDVARAIAQEIRVTVTPEEQKRLTVTRQVKPEAYELYLKGKFFLEKGGESGLTKAVENFNLAIAKDSNYALAYSGLGMAYQAYCVWGWLSPEEGFRKVEEAAAAALKKDSTLAEAHLLLALKKYLYDWDFQGAGKEFRIAIEMNPGSSTVHANYSTFLVVIESIEAGIAEIKRAQELDPLSTTTKLNLSVIYWFHARQYDNGIRVSKEILEMDPRCAMAYFYLGSIYLLQNRYVEALQAFRQCERLEPHDIYNKYNFALAHAWMGEHERAEEYLGQIVNHTEKTYFPLYHLAILYAQLGQIDRAMECLEKAYQKHDIFLVGARSDPYLDPLRSDPRFMVLLKNIGLGK